MKFNKPSEGLLISIKHSNSLTNSNNQILGLRTHTFHYSSLKIHQQGRLKTNNRRPNSENRESVYQYYKRISDHLISISI